MKKYLLPEQGKFYKANLHMHTTVSDGRITPEQTKADYMAEGYSIVAFTDHEVMIAHEDLTDENFLAITSVEFNAGKGDGLPWEYGGTRCYHFNLYAKNPKNATPSIFSERYVWGNAREYVTDEMRKCDDDRQYTQAYMNDAIRRAKEEGFLVSYNHPVWSLQRYSDYCDLEGLWGVEIYNTGCVRAGYVDTVQPLDDFLQAGKQVFPLATDDSHTLFDRFGGWVMVKAEKLEYTTVMDALERGDFYSSTGPVIEELFIEDGVLTIVCPNAKEVWLNSPRRYAKRVLAEDGQTLNVVKFDIKDHLERSKLVSEQLNEKPCIRITVKDEKGYCAYTRAYFLEELI